MPGQHLAQVGRAGHAQHVFVQHRRVETLLAVQRRAAAVRVRDQTTEGLEGMEEAVGLREEVHVVEVVEVGVGVVGAGKRGPVEA